MSSATWRKHACCVRARARAETDKPVGKSSQIRVRTRATGRIGTAARAPFRLRSQLSPGSRHTTDASSAESRRGCRAGAQAQAPGTRRSVLIHSGAVSRSGAGPATRRKRCGRPSIHVDTVKASFIILLSPASPSPSLIPPRPHLTRRDHPRPLLLLYHHHHHHTSPTRCLLPFPFPSPIPRLLPSAPIRLPRTPDLLATPTPW